MGGDIDSKDYEQDQGQVFPSHLSEALDASDSIFFIDDFVDGLSLKAFEARYAGTSKRACPLHTLLNLWLFVATEVPYSGREIARCLSRDLRFRYLAGGLTPDFRTINRFRIHHREYFANVFRETVHTARRSSQKIEFRCDVRVFWSDPGSLPQVSLVKTKVNNPRPRKGEGNVAEPNPRNHLLHGGSPEGAQ